MRLVATPSLVRLSQSRGKSIGPLDLGRALKRGDVVKLDFGAIFEGYHSDMTRTIAFDALPGVFDDFIKGKAKGRIVVDLAAG